MTQFNATKSNLRSSGEFDISNNREMDSSSIQEFNEKEESEDISEEPLSRKKKSTIIVPSPSEKDKEDKSSNE